MARDGIQATLSRQIGVLVPYALPQPDTYVSAHFWHLAGGSSKKAAVAIAHTSLVISWHLLTKTAMSTWEAITSSAGTKAGTWNA